MSVRFGPKGMSLSEIQDSTDDPLLLDLCAYIERLDDEVFAYEVARTPQDRIEQNIYAAAFTRAYIELHQGIDLDEPIPPALIGPVTASRENAERIAERVVELLHPAARTEQ